MFTSLKSAELSSGASSFGRSLSTPISAAADVSFLAMVPGMRTDIQRSEVIRNNLASDVSGVVSYTNDAESRAALVALPCCVSNKGGSKHRDASQWGP